jgi:allantoicase
MHQTEPMATAPFTHLVDLAAEKVGGRALWATDDFFAEKENLLKPGRGVFIADRYTERGKWMDGWESRRKRVPGHDTCIIRLGLPGIVRGVDVDTNHFTGNFPEFASIEGCEADREASAETLLGPDVAWTELLPISKLQGGSQNLFPVTCGRRFTHLKLHIYPDGGVARLRVHGEVMPRLRATHELIDLAALEHGGTVVLANDSYFGPKDNLLLPGEPAHMGEGWETRRRRAPGNDWIVVKLGAAGLLERIQVDTTHFKGNFPDRCSIEATRVSGNPLPEFFASRTVAWEEVLPPSKLQAHHKHVFEELRSKGPYTHVRLSIYPDGGVARLRVFGRLVPAGA